MGTSRMKGGGERSLSGRERILEAAYRLFSRNGIRAVGVDAIIAEAGVAKMTLYRNFISKDELALAYLELREERWTVDWLKAEVCRRASEPGERLIAVFDVFDEWFSRSDFEGCAFINALLDHPHAEDPIGQASAEHLATIREFLRELAAAAGVKDADGLAAQWHILMKGSIIAAAEGDTAAARRAKELGRILLREREAGALPGPAAAAA